MADEAFGISVRGACATGPERRIAGFVVECDGSVTVSEMEGGEYPALKRALWRTVPGRPRWTPGMMRDSASGVMRTVPVRFGMPVIAHAPEIRLVLPRSARGSSEGRPFSAADDADRAARGFRARVRYAPERVSRGRSGGVAPECDERDDKVIFFNPFRSFFRELHCVLRNNSYLCAPVKCGDWITNKLN